MPRSNSAHPIQVKPQKRDKVSSSIGISVANNAPIDVYYGGSSVAVPFMWESCPGTPKVRFREKPLPPLTPPPSFLSNPAETTAKKSFKLKFFRRLLPKLSLRKTSQQPASPASSSSSSSSRSSRSVPSSPLIYASPRVWSGSIVENDDDFVSSPVSTLCFGIGGGGGGGGATPGSRGRTSNAFKVLLAESAMK